MGKHVRSTHGARFKLEFVCIQETLASGGTVRALVLAQSEIPGDPNHLHVALAYEGGGQPMHKIIRRQLFNNAVLKHEVVSLVESESAEAPGMLIGRDGIPIKFERS
jgi:hypothetical protein